jgi:hypothetical protein
LDSRLLTLDDGHDGALLDGGGPLKTVGVHSAKELSFEVHVVEGVRCLIVVGLDLACAGLLDICAKFFLLFSRESWCRAAGAHSTGIDMKITHPRAHPQDLCQP